MDGYTATREIREHERRAGLPRVPIVAITANAYREDRARCAEAGMDDYITKPFTAPGLVATLGRLLEQQDPDGDGRKTPDPIVSSPY